MKILSFRRKEIVIMFFLLAIAVVLAYGNTISTDVGGTNIMESSTNISIYNVLNFGAIANGKVDDTKAINSAISYATEHGGGIVWLPVGDYKIDGTIFVSPGIVLEGAAWRTMGMPSNTTTILAYPSSTSTKSSFLKPVMPTIALSDGAVVKDLVIYYPKQDLNNVIPYPPAIGGSGNMMTVENVTLINPYIGIDFMGGDNSSLHYIKNVYGCPLHIGIEIDNCFDIGRVENVHFNPNFWQPGNVELENYIHNNLYAFIVGRSDWEYFLNTFVWGAKVGYLFEQTSQGACNGNFVGIGSDWSGRAVWVKASQPMGIQIVNGEFVGSPVCPAVIQVDSGKLLLSNCTIWGPMPKEDILLNNGTVMVNGCNFENWAAGANDLPAIKAISGKLIVNGSYFAQSGIAIEIQADVLSSITGNIFQLPESQAVVKK